MGNVTLEPENYGGRSVVSWEFCVREFTRITALVMERDHLPGLSPPRTGDRLAGGRAAGACFLVGALCCNLCLTPSSRSGVSSPQVKWPCSPSLVERE